MLNRQVDVLCHTHAVELERAAAVHAVKCVMVC